MGVTPVKVTREAFDQARGKACSGPLAAENEALEHLERDQAEYEWSVISQAAAFEAVAMLALASKRWEA
jgi:hypothetical protein